MKRVALTGGIGAGKSVVLAEFAKLGADVIDADQISREIMMVGRSGYNEVVKEFGDKILKSDNSIDRKLLASIVFSDEMKLKKLNEITHRLIYEEIKAKINVSPGELVCVEIPLLFTSHCPIDFDLTIAVIADDEKRKKRVAMRDNCSDEQVKERMANQLSNDEFRKRADEVIENNGNMSLIREKVMEICNRLLVSTAERREV